MLQRARYYHKALGLKADDTFTTKMLGRALEEECERYGSSGADDDLFALGAGGGLGGFGLGGLGGADVSVSFADSSGALSNSNLSGVSIGGSLEDDSGMQETDSDEAGGGGGASSVLMDESGMSMQMSDDDDD